MTGWRATSATSARATSSPASTWRCGLPPAGRAPQRVRLRGRCPPCDGLHVPLTCRAFHTGAALQPVCCAPNYGGNRPLARSRSMSGLLVVLFLFIALIGYLIGTYNGLVQVRAAVKLAWSNIDVLLVQRHDELPKLVEVCKQYMQYE